jgi:WD40 repeat protein
VRVWGRGAAKAHAVLTGASVDGLVTAPDGSWLAIGRAKTGELVDTRTWRVIQALPGSPRARSSRGDLAMTGEAGALWLRTPIATRELADHGAAITALVFSPDGSRMWAADVAGTLRAWSVASGAPELAITTHMHGAITALAATADGRWIIEGDATGAIRIEPATVDAARARACSLLGFFDRIGTLVDVCRH